MRHSFTSMFRKAFFDDGFLFIGEAQEISSIPEDVAGILQGFLQSLFHCVAPR